MTPPPAPFVITTRVDPAARARIDAAVRRALATKPPQPLPSTHQEPPNQKTG
ncbi:hypothetical protein ACFFLM_04625 [Deinococcus oregonensis]|uniref:Uncharacterized protein n=1 Tax=Deinococcus oregonensis TaxID=1805970 RepID=A0ABV6AUT1_9DEIO